MVEGDVLVDGGEKYLSLSKLFDDDNAVVSVLDRGLSGKGSRLIVRDFYDKLGNDILESIGTKNIKRVYMTGTPGTGKSTFRNYLAWKILKRFFADRNAVRIAMHKGGQPFFYLLCLEADGSFRVEFWNVDQLHQHGMIGFELGHNFFGLSDVSKGNDMHSEVFTGGSIIFSSPNEEAWQQGAKQDCKFFYMPLWEKEELCRFDTTEKVFNDRFEKYGGVARVVWGSEDTIETHCTRLKNTMVEFKNLQADVESTNVWSKSHRFVYLKVEKDKDGNYLFTKNPTLIIQTRHLADLVAKKYVAELLNLTNKFFDVPHASVYGILFERVALELIGNKENAEKCVFHIHRSTKGCQFPLFSGDLLVSGTIPSKKETFNATNFVEKITEPNVLALPSSDYFPGFDGAISFKNSAGMHLALLQMTTAHKHPLSAMGLAMLERAHDSAVFKKIVIIHVLPNKNALKHFGLQGLQVSNCTGKEILDRTSQITMSIGIKGKQSEGDGRKRAKTDGAAEEGD